MSDFDENDPKVKQVRKHIKQVRSFYTSIITYVVVLIFLTILNYVLDKNIPVLHVAIAWGLGLVLWGVVLFFDRNGSLFGAEWEERKVNELLARERIQKLSTEKQLVEAKMRMLQAQIEPHFLFNTLANVQSLIGRAPDQASTMLDSFILYLRRSLNASRSTQGTLAQEIDLLSHYLELLKIRMGTRLTYNFEIDSTLNAMPLAPMLLQPLVENAVKHGLEPKVEGGHVSVRAERLSSSASEVRISIVDNGLGFNENTSGEGGVGLSNLRERLSVLYDGKATVQVTDSQPGTKVMLTFPYVISTTINRKEAAN